jgi:TM2 domain-containing membrane protein YozV
MEQSKIETFLALNARYFASDKLPLLSSEIAKLDDSRFIPIQSLEYRDPTTMLLISLFGGHFGVDRFMLGQTGLGVLKLLTCGGIGIWTIVDWIQVMKMTREYNFSKIMQHLH